MKQQIAKRPVMAGANAPGRGKPGRMLQSKAVRVWTEMKKTSTLMC